ncbi:MAG: SLBB domain-containing protein [Steroidobacteraceae bacterium]
MRFESRALLATVWLILGLMLVLSAAHAEDYRVGEGDLLRISVFDHPELALEARVSQSGSISYPLIGLVQIAGMSTRQVELLIAQKLTEGNFIKQPQVSIIVGEFQSQKIGVIGQVTKPGQYSLTGTTLVLDALSMSGGVLNDSAADEATLIRKDGASQAIDLRKLFDGDASMNVQVRNGDTLSVPKAPQFYIYGEVQKPGTYRLSRGMTLSQAISAGGGLTNHGTERRAVVKRRDAKGKEQEYSLKSNGVLQADDVVMIKQSWF